MMLKTANCEDIELIGFHSPKTLNIYRPLADQSSFQTTSCNQMNDSGFNPAEKRILCNCLNLPPTSATFLHPQTLCYDKQTCQTLSSSGHPKYNYLGPWKKCANERMYQEGLRDLPSDEDLSSRIVVLPAYTTACQSWKSDKDIGSYINTSKLAPIIKWENLLTGDEDEICINQDDSKPWKFYKSKVNIRDDDNNNSPNSYWSGLDQTSFDVANNNLQNITSDSKSIDQNKKVFRSSCYFELQENNRLVMTKGLATMPRFSSEPINAGSSTDYSPEGVIPKIFVSFNGDSYTSRIHYYMNNMNDLSSKISPLSYHDELTSQNYQTSDNYKKQPLSHISELHRSTDSEFKADSNKAVKEPLCLSNSSSYEEIKTPRHSEDSSMIDRNNPLSNTFSQSRDITRTEKHDKCITLVADDQIFKWTPNSESFQIQIDHVSMTRSLNESFFSRKLKKFGSKRNISLSELVSEKSKSRLKFLESKMETIRNLGKSNLQDNKLLRIVKPLSPKCLKQLFKKDGEHSEMKQLSVPTIIISDEEDMISVQTENSDRLSGDEIKIYPKHEKNLSPTKDKYSSDLKLRIEPSVSSGAVTLFFKGCLDENVTQKSESSISDDSSDEQSGITKQKDVFRSSKSVTFSLDTKTGSPVVRKKMRTGFFASPEDWTCLPDISGSIQSKKWNNPSDDSNQTHSEKDFPSFSLSKMKNYLFSKNIHETSIYYDEDFESKTNEAKLCFKKMKWKKSSTRRYCVLHAICLIGVENFENLFRMPLPVTIQLEGNSSQLNLRQQSNDDGASTKKDGIKNQVPAKRPTTLEGLKPSTEMDLEIYEGSRKLNNLTKSHLHHLVITERDILQVEMFYRSHMTEVFVCRSSVILHFKVLKKRALFQVMGPLDEAFNNDEKLSSSLSSSSCPTPFTMKELSEIRKESKMSKSFSPPCSIPDLSNKLERERSNFEGMKSTASSSDNLQEDWEAVKSGLLLLILDSGNNKRRSRRLHIALAELGTGFTLWRDSMNHLSSYDECTSTFHTMRLSRDHNMLAGFSFGNEEAARTFYSIISDLSSDRSDTLLNISSSTSNEKKSLRGRVESFLSHSSTHSLPVHSDLRTSSLEPTSSEKFMTLTYSPKLCRRKLKKSEISGPCCFLHVGGVDRSEKEGVLRRTNDDNFEVVPNKIVTLNYFEFTPRQKKLHSILKKTS